MGLVSSKMRALQHRFPLVMLTAFEVVVEHNIMVSVVSDCAVRFYGLQSKLTHPTSTKGMQKTLHPYLLLHTDITSLVQ